MKWLLTDLLMTVAIVGALLRVRGFLAFAGTVCAIGAVVLRFLWLALAVVVMASGTAYAADATYATWNPADKHSTIELSNGNLTAKAVTLDSSYKSVRATLGKDSGKWYFEFVLNTQQGSQVMGVATAAADLTNHLCVQTVAWTFYYTGQKLNNSTCSLTSYGSSYTHGDVIGVAVDLDADMIWTSKGGVWNASGNPATGANPAFSNVSGTVFPAWSGSGINSGSAAQITVNFGASPFTYTPPAGFIAGWCENCGEEPPEPPSIDPLLAMRSFSGGAFVLLGGVLAVIFIQGIRTGRRG